MLSNDTDFELGEVYKKRGMSVGDKTWENPGTKTQIKHQNLKSKIDRHDML